MRLVVRIGWRVYATVLQAGYNPMKAMWMNGRAGCQKFFYFVLFYIFYLLCVDRRCSLLYLQEEGGVEHFCWHARDGDGAHGVTASDRCARMTASCQCPVGSAFAFCIISAWRAEAAKAGGRLAWPHQLSSSSICLLHGCTRHLPTTAGDTCL